jgi:hypothetical protein
MSKQGSRNREGLNRERRKIAAKDPFLFSPQSILHSVAY